MKVFWKVLHSCIQSSGYAVFKEDTWKTLESTAFRKSAKPWLGQIPVSFVCRRKIRDLLASFAKRPVVFRVGSPQKNSFPPCGKRNFFPTYFTRGNVRLCFICPPPSNKIPFPFKILSSGKGGGEGGKWLINCCENLQKWNKNAIFLMQFCNFLKM